MRVLVALIAFVAVAVLNFLWWWWPNRPVEIAGWTTAPLQSVSFAAYRPGQSPLSKIYPTVDQIEDDLRRLQGKVQAVRTYTTSENLETVPQRAGKYGLKVWHGAWLNENDKENLEEINLLIDHANRYKDTIERVIVGNEVLLRKQLTANQLRRYIRQVKQRVSQPVTYADVWEFWLRNPSLADEVDFITIHILPYWEDEPIGLDRREPDGKLSIEKHIVDIYKKVQDRFPGKKIVIGETGWPSDGRMRSDARPGRVEQVRYFSLFRSVADREKFDYNIVEAFDQYWKARQEGTVGATWGLLDAQRRDKFELGKPVSAEPNWPMLFTLSTLAAGLMLGGFVVLRRQARGKAIAIFAVFTQLVATCYVQATWTDISRMFYFEREVGVVFWAILLALFSYALLRGIADSLTGKMADPSLYGARVREAWRAWRELPRYRIVQRADLMAQMLYLVLTVLCIFYLVVISIDWYDGVFRIGTFFRHIAIDGRYRDFPIWSFVIPSIVLMAWKTSVAGRPLDQGAVVRPAAGLRRQQGLRAHGPQLQPASADPARGRLLLPVDLLGRRVGGDRGRHQAARRRGGRLRLRRWRPLGDRDTLLEHPGQLVRRAGRADGGAVSCDHLRIAARATGRTAAGLLYQQVVSTD